MALFKILRGPSSGFTTNLSASSVNPPFHDGYCYYLTDTHLFYVDYEKNGTKVREPLNAKDALRLLGTNSAVYTMEADDTQITNNYKKIPSSGAVHAEISAVKNILDGVTTTSIPNLENSKMNKVNPTGSGALSINRKASTTVGTNSVAVGNNNTASGNYSFAEGTGNTASGAQSHAGGSGSTASGAGSFVHGQGLTNAVQYQAVFGKYNKAESTALFIVGKGTSSARSNAFVIDSSGNGYIANTLAIGAVKPTSSGDHLYVNGSACITSHLQLDTAPTAGNHAANKKYVDDKKVARVTSTDNAIARFNGTGGQIQNSGVLINDSNSMSVPSSVIINGTEYNDGSGQLAMLKALSTTASAAGTNWVGRSMFGAKNLTFLMGTYNGMAGIGAHSWTDAAAGTGAAWAPMYLQPDGGANAAIYMGQNGTGWTANTGTLVVKGNATANAGSVSVNGVLNVTKNIEASADVNISNNLTTGGTGTFRNNVIAEKDILVSGVVTIGTGVTLSYNSTNKSLDFIFS